MIEYPKTLKELQAELHKYAHVGRADRPFRFAIAISQLGNIAMHLTHDLKENPQARPYGTASGHIADAGHALAQIIIYLDASGIDIQEAMEVALDAIREKDCLKKEELIPEYDIEKSNTVLGMIGCEGNVKGTAWLDPEMNRKDFNKPHDAILVTNHPYSDARLKNYIGVITDNGGSACHAAVVCREFNIPCIVGTGVATMKIKDGDKLEMSNSGRYGVVRIL